MNNKFLQYLNNDISLYPVKLEDGFPRIFDKLLEFCDTTDFNQYLTELLFDIRGSRTGFPEEIVNELWKLQWHRMRLEAASANEDKPDYWNWIKDQ